MSLPAATDVAVVGGGQAGLTMSALLLNAGRDHIVLERRKSLGGGWQDRWDGFCLVTPNWTASFPGDAYDGPDPDGYMPRDAIASRVAGYAGLIGAPVLLDTAVERLVANPAGGFRLDTSQGTMTAAAVVVATGSFHLPRVPAELSEALPTGLLNLHAHAYRKPDALPPGGVLVVGSAQSGVQIAEELFEAGRPVWLSVGSAGRIPRRYRGSDIFRWLDGLAHDGESLGVMLPTVDQLPDPRLRSAGNPHLSGHHGGHETNLRRMAADGMTLLGRIAGADGSRLRVEPDLAGKLDAADRFFDERFRGLIDTYIDRSGIAAPPDDRAPFAFDPPVLEALDLAEAGIGAVIWATGYGLDFRWIDLPIFDEAGFPRHRRGVSEVDGLYFVGLLWQHTQASATLFGVGLEAEHVAREMGLPA